MAGATHQPVGQTAASCDWPEPIQTCAASASRGARSRNSAGKKRIWKTSGSLSPPAAQLYADPGWQKPTIVAIPLRVVRVRVEYILDWKRGGGGSADADDLNADKRRLHALHARLDDDDCSWR